MISRHSDNYFLQISCVDIVLLDCQCVQTSVWKIQFVLPCTSLGFVEVFLEKFSISLYLVKDSTGDYKSKMIKGRQMKVAVFTWRNCKL